MTATDDRALMQTLAQACGWTVTLQPEGGCAVVIPDGAKAWTVFNEIGTWDSIIESHMLPDWLHSVDAALALPWPDGSEQIVGWRGPKTPGALLLLADGREYRSYSQTTLARALCEVFAQWWQAKGSDDAPKP
jgi:hypothetical protein